MRSRLTFANVISCLALFIALGGASYAATQLPKNSIGSKQIKKGSIQVNDLSKGARKVLATPGPRGPVGATGAVGPAGPQTSTLASGQTLRGTYNLDIEAAAPGDGVGGDISFGLNLPQRPRVEIVPKNGPATSNCPGSAANPQASKGFLCVYKLTETTNTDGIAVCDLGCESEESAADTWGAELFLFANAKGRVFSDGTWAVTAP
jgi:hypothetical protein